MPQEQEEFVADEQAEILESEPRSILLGLLSQLTKGMDLHRVALPTFVLEPRSMLERITDFMSHPDILVNAAHVTDPEERFVQVLAYYLSGWHIRPKGVKKPYNPALGEYFRCRWKFDDDSEAFYVAEQVCHHPPISAFCYASPENHVLVEGEFRPKSKYLGNSAATLMEGNTVISFPGTQHSEKYVVTNPNVYARGLLIGTMLLELGDVSVIKSDETDLMAEIEFVVKGFFGGTYNAIKGKIKRQSTGETLYHLTGKWSDVIYIQKNVKGQQQEILFDSNASVILPKLVLPEAKQGDYESRKLWAKLTGAIQKRDMDTATKEKIAVEDAQRKIRHDRESENDPVLHAAKYFVCKDDKWHLNVIEEVTGTDTKLGKQKLSNFIFVE